MESNINIIRLPTYFVKGHSLDFIQTRAPGYENMAVQTRKRTNSSKFQNTYYIY